MKIELSPETIDSIVKKVILQDISTLREQLVSLRRELSYNPEYLTRNSYVNREIQDVTLFLHALETAAEFYIGAHWQKNFEELEFNSEK